VFDLISVGYVSLDKVKIGDREFESCGGAALHSALSASLFAKTGIVSRIGEDFDMSCLAGLADSGIDLGGIKEVAGRSSRFNVSYDSLWSDTYDLVEFGVGETISPDELPPAYFAARMLLINSMHPEVQAGWGSLTRSYGISTAITTNYFFTKHRALGSAVLKLIHGTEFFICNYREAVSLLGQTEYLMNYE